MVDLEYYERLLTEYRPNKQQAAAIRQRAMQYALSTGFSRTLSTVGQAEKLQRLFERERKLLNKCAYVRRVWDMLTVKDREILRICYIYGRGYRSAGVSLPYSERTFYRRRNIALTRFASFAEKLVSEFEEQ